MALIVSGVLAACYFCRSKARATAAAQSPDGKQVGRCLKQRAMFKLLWVVSCGLGVAIWGFGVWG